MSESSSPLFSIIIPALNEDTVIQAFLNHLQPVRKKGVELVFVDGSSVDGTTSKARPFVDQLLVSEPGRAKQMNAGAHIAKGRWLVFLHVDTFVSEDFITSLETAVSTGSIWGRFDVMLSGKHPYFRVIEYFINRRSRLTRIATGDQVIFVKKDAFVEVNGYEEIPLMEDISLCKKLKKLTNPVCLTDKVNTSSRRWEEKGILKTVLLMWGLRLAYFFGVSPDELVDLYSNNRTGNH